jgi:2-iminobutanoate/2-iminopropanoate deaminase
MARGRFVFQEKEMSEVKVVSTKSAPAAIGPYVQGKVVGGFLFASGQIPLDPATGSLVSGGIEEQARQALKNVKALVEAAGSDMTKVVKTTCFLKDIGDFAAFNKVYAEFFTGDAPARSCVGAIDLPKGALCEIEVIAAV